MSLEIRPNDDGTLDEICASGIANLHMEQMDADTYWMRLDYADGSADVIWMHRRRVREDGMRFMHEHEEALR